MTDSRINEETPLLHSANDPTVVVHKESDGVVTPLPKLQIAILLLVQLAEPICSQCIYPFTPQVIRRSVNTHSNTRLTYFQLINELGITGGDQKKVGYYTGEQERLRAVCALNPEPSI